MKRRDKDLDEVCSWLLRNVKDSSKIRQPARGGTGLVIWVHSKIIKAMKMYAKRYAEKKLEELKKKISKHERRIRRLETQTVPCCIEVNKRCNEPFCKMMYYSRLAEQSKIEYFNKIKEELEEYNRKGNRNG